MDEQRIKSKEAKELEKKLSDVLFGHIFVNDRHDRDRAKEAIEITTTYLATMMIHDLYLVGITDLDNILVKMMNYVNTSLVGIVKDREKLYDFISEEHKKNFSESEPENKLSIIKPK